MLQPQKSASSRVTWRVMTTTDSYNGDLVAAVNAQGWVTFFIGALYWLIANIVKTLFFFFLKEEDKKTKSTFDLFKWPVLRLSITYLSFFFTGSPQVFLFRDVVVVKMLKVCIEGKKKKHKCGRVGVCKTPPCLRAFVSVSAFFSSSSQNGEGCWMKKPTTMTISQVLGFLLPLDLSPPV